MEQRKAGCELAEAAAPTKSHSCSICLRSFKRKEHLTRHQRSHSLERPFSCPLCGRSFGRQDSFSRHVAGHSNSASGGVSAAHVACDSCYRSKVRCERGLPCLRCTSTGQKCIVSRSIIPAKGSRKAVNTLPGSHPVIMGQGTVLEPIHHSWNDIAHHIDINHTDPEVPQNEIVRMGRRATSVTGEQTLQPPPSHDPVATVSLNEQPPLLSDALLPPDVVDLRRLPYSLEEASIQHEILSGLSAFQTLEHKGLSFDQQAQKWLHEFCSESR